MPDSFSRRMGLEEKPLLQINSIDDNLKNGLWNILEDFILPAIIHKERQDGIEINQRLLPGSRYPNLARIYNLHFRLSEQTRVNVDEATQENLYESWHNTFHNANWNKTFDLIEWSFDYIFPPAKKRIISEINKILKKENGGYKLWPQKNSYEFIPITDETEMEALTGTKQVAKENELPKIKQELDRSQKHCFDRTSPDYKASIAASFNACESAIKFYLDGEKVTMGKGLDRIPEASVPKAMKEGFKKYYGYASQYIRHGQADNNTKTKEHDPSFDEAKFFLVATHAFCNYLISKKAKIPKSK